MPLASIGHPSSTIYKAMMALRRSQLLAAIVSMNLAMVIMATLLSFLPSAILQYQDEKSSSTNKTPMTSLLLLRTTQLPQRQLHQPPTPNQA
ncbi:MAG: hypothetical protein Q9218_006399, partial [Villophora microphyllina]